MKINHKIFHLEKDIERENLVNSANSCFDLFSEELNTPTIHISSEEDILEFVKLNPDFKLSGNGYSLHGQQGWKLGEIGIWASNWLAWKNFLNSDADYLILMEDDIVVEPDFKYFLVDYINELPQDWDVLHMFAPADQFHKYSLESHGIGKNCICKAYQDWSCLCYIINKRSAQKMIEKSYMANLPLDWYMFRQQNIFNVYSIKPTENFACRLAILDSTFQNIQERRIINGIF